MKSLLVSLTFGILLLIGWPQEKSSEQNLKAIQPDNSVLVNDEGLTFFITSDTHYGKKDSLTLFNAQTIRAMNDLPGIPFPDTIQEKVNKPKGVIVTGDLTEGKKEHWDQFVTHFGLNGKGGILEFPVYEGFGNHDGPIDGPVRSGIKERNKKRKNVTDVSSNGLHYSWDWGNYHFANLNSYPGSEWDPNCEWCHYFKTSFRDPQHSLEFLKKDLEENVGNTEKPVILTFHYGFDDWGYKWWTKDERDAFYDVIKNYNIKAIFYGHTHTVKAHEWRGIPVFCVGSSQKDKSAGDFMVVNIRDDEMIIAQRKLNEWGDVFVVKSTASVAK